MSCHVFFLNNTFYFITCPATERKSFFSGNKKDIILENLIKSCTKHKIKKLDFGIISNHYHLLGYFEKGTIIPQFLKDINGPSAMAINKMDNISNRKIWDEYYVYFVNNNEVLRKIKGYAIGNPYKHQEVDSLEELKDYKYSSFKNTISKIGITATENLVLSVININYKDFIKELEKTNTNKLARKREQVRLEKNIINKTT